MNSDNEFDISKHIWVAIDLETTGINPWKYEIIEIGAVKFTIDNILENYQVLIKPEKKQDPKSRKIHNISDEELNDNAISKLNAINGLLNFIDDYPLIFHNASFDLAFLKIALDELNIKLPKNYYYDTLYLLRTYKPDLESYSLTSLQKQLDLNVQLHRALNDSIVTSHVFQWLLNDKIAQLSSRKHFKSFFRYHRKMSDFIVTLPKTLDNIYNYFNKFIQSKSLLKICESVNNPTMSNNVKLIIPQEIMIFNQNIMLKCQFYPGEQSTLIPLSNYLILDPDRGPLPYDNI